MMNDATVLQIFRETNALLEGHFLLRSGLHSRQYFQCALVLQWPRQAERLCAALAEKLEKHIPAPRGGEGQGEGKAGDATTAPHLNPLPHGERRPDVTVISPAMGGLFIGHEVGRALGIRHIFAEKDAAGKLELRRNFQIGRGEKLIVVEDVITKGGRMQETIDIVRHKGAEVVAAGTLVDRSAGNVNFGVPLVSLLKLQIETFEPASCPLCLAGTPVVKPGS